MIQVVQQTQTAPTETEQTDPRPEAQTDEAVLSTGVEAVETPERAEFDFGQVDEQWIQNALERSEALKNWAKQQQDNGFNAGRQRRDKELRLERGSEDVARAVQERWRQKYGVELDEEDQREAPLWAAANRSAARYEIARSFVEGELDAFDPEDRERITSVMDRLDDDPDAMEQVRDQVLEIARNRRATSMIADLTLDEVPQNSRLRADLDQHIRSEVEKELAARLAERETVDNPPPTPAGGSAVPKTLGDLKNMSRDEITTLRKSMGDEAFYAVVAGKS